MSMVTSHAINTVKVKKCTGVARRESKHCGGVGKLRVRDSIHNETVFFVLFCPKTAKGLNGLMKWTKKTGVRTRKMT